MVAVGVAEGSKWLIRRLEADGRWTTLNLFAHPNSKYVLSRPSTIALDGTGSIYVAGNATETVVTYKGTTATTTTVNRPLLRKFESGLWVTINLPASISGIVRVGNNLYSSAGSPDGWWQVRKSTDGGFNWVLVDNFRYDVSSPSGANDIAADGNGNVFVVGSGVWVVTTGTGKTAKTISHRSWIVRKGVAAGTTWATSNVFELGARTDGHGAFNIAQAVTVDQNNNVHVTGFGISDLRRWVTRQLPSGTVVWLTSDNFPYATGYYTSGWGNAADASGNVFSIGSAGNNTGVNRNWLVRGKLVTP